MKLASPIAIALTCLLSSAAFSATPNYKIVDRIKVADGGFDYAAYDPATHHVLIARTDNTMVIDVSNNSITELSSASHGHLALPIPGTTNILLPQGQAGAALIVDTATDKVLATIPVGKSPDAALYDPYSKLVFVMTAEGNAVAIDTVARKVVDTIVVGDKLEFAVSDGAGKIFVNDEDKGEIAVIDVAARKTVNRYKMPGCEGPTGLAYVAPLKLLVSSCDGVAKVLRADSGAEVASIPIGIGADAVIYDPVHHIVAIPCGRAGELDIISVADAGHLAVDEKLLMPAAARTGTVDPSTGRIYMLGAQYGAPNPGGRFPRPQPGTFEVMVVGE